MRDLERGMKANSKWRELFKFLAGAAFVGAFANAFLWLANVTVPFLGIEISPGVFGLRAIGATILFALMLYLGYLKNGHSRQA